MRPVSRVFLLILCCGCSSTALRRENEALLKVCEALHAKLSDAQMELHEIRHERQQEERTRLGKQQLCTTLLGLSSQLQGRSNLHLLDLDDEKTYGAAKIAADDVAEGLLVGLTGGYTFVHEPEVVEYLKKEFGIDYVWLCGCTALEPTWRFIAAYNEVSSAAVKKKTGKTFNEILKSKPVATALKKAAARAKEEYEKWRKEEALRKKRIEALRKNMRPLLEKGDFARARETAAS